MRIIRANEQLLREYSVRSLALFGSVARNKTRSGSDVDLLVEFEPEGEIGLFEFAELRERLSTLLDAPVDLATPEALHPTLRQQILGECVRVA